MLSFASCNGRFFDANLIKHFTLSSFGSCDNWENAINEGLFSASHDNNGDDGDDRNDDDGNNDNMLVD